MSEMPKQVSISVLDPKVVLGVKDRSFERFCRCDTPEQATEVFKRYNAYADQQTEIVTMNDKCVQIRRGLEKQIADQQTEITHLKDRLITERIEFVNVIDERDALKKYKEILDVALASAEKMKEKE